MKKLALIALIALFTAPAFADTEDTITVNLTIEEYVAVSITDPAETPVIIITEGTGGGETDPIGYVVETNIPTGPRKCLLTGSVEESVAGDWDVYFHNGTDYSATSLDFNAPGGTGNFVVKVTGITLSDAPVTGASVTAKLTVAADDV